MEHSPQTVCLKCGAGVTSETYHVDPSPVHDLLSSNLPPTGKAQVDAARTIIKDIASEIAGIEQDILRMHAALSLLAAKRTALHDYAEAHKGLISPLRRLPAEILSDIFIRALPPFPCKLKSSEIPILLELVCRRWRDVVRSTPALWSRIELDYAHKNTVHQSAIASTCLARSIQHPLTISLTSSGIYVPPDWVHPTLALIVAQCERWRTVQLDFLPLYAIEELAEAKGRLPLLERLYVSTYDATTTIKGKRALLDAFSLAPKLRYLELESQEFKDIVTDNILHLPWNGLTHLIVDLRHAADILSILLQCHDLVHFEAHVSNTPMSDDLPEVHLPYLRSLSLKLPEFPTILPKLILPALTQVSLTPLYVLDFTAELWHTNSGFDKLLKKSGCTVRQLEVHDESQCIQLRDFVGLLEVLPSLTKLNISETLSNMLPQIFADHENIRRVIGPNCHIATIVSSLRED
ncbi:hypothetical protein HWV62_12072 [Athelia sp. TMB]|nr:hypothetical protein HWV62_16618 [Athelia sp. TMB]KAF7974504.1 hypothetical protein HWV62_12072 [Athelia sp. TMB]